MTAVIGSHSGKMIRASPASYRIHVVTEGLVSVLGMLSECAPSRQPHVALDTYVLKIWNGHHINATETH